MNQHSVDLVLLLKLAGILVVGGFVIASLGLLVLAGLGKLYDRFYLSKQVEESYSKEDELDESDEICEECHGSGRSDQGDMACFSCSYRDQDSRRFR